MLPADSHVHTEWSWDAAQGSMERTCARAVEIGLPAIAFTEHLDHTVWWVERERISDHLRSLTNTDGVLVPTAFDAAGYLASIERCRDRFPGLRILSGLEMGEPHWYGAQYAKVLAAGTFDRLLGSLHSLPERGGFAEPSTIMPYREPAGVVREYLAGVATMAATSEVFAVLAHIDYPIRVWPVDRAGPFEPKDFEDEFRHALRTTAESGRALEINTRIPLHATILRWWHEEGGDAITFGSDAHQPSMIAHGFADAAQMAEAHGFRPGRNPYDLWSRVD